jgi:hypothetical protein
VTTDSSDADLAEQQRPVLDEEDDLAGLDLDEEADVMDALDQRRPVPLDEDEG